MRQFIITFYLGGICNLSCSYCHQTDTIIYTQDGELLKKMPAGNFENIQKASKIIQQLSYHGHVQVNLFGGEPFLYKKEATFLIEDIYKNSCIENINISISTNGTIIDHDILNLMNTNFGRKSLIDISWHTIEYPEITSKIEQFAKTLVERYPHIELKSTVVIDKGAYEKMHQLFQIFSTAHGATGGCKTTLNFHCSSYWTNTELIDLFKFLQVIKAYNLDKKLNLDINSTGCGLLIKDRSEVLFMPSGEIILCPYIIMTNIREDIYKHLSVGNLSTNNIDGIVETIVHKEYSKLYCKCGNYTALTCFFLHPGMRKLNKYVGDNFNSSIVYF